MKILLVSTSFFPKVDGSTRCVYDHARKLAERGNLVYLSTRGVRLRKTGSAGTKQFEIFEGIRIVRSRLIARSSSGFGLNKIRLAVEQMVAIMRLQRKIGFDVIHVHGYSAGMAALPCKYIFGIPIVITTHGTELLWPKSVWWKSPTEIILGLIFEKTVLDLCDVIIAQSEGVQKYMMQIYGPQIEKKIRIVPTGVDERKFKVQPKENARPQILFVGALSEVKGVTMLLNAFSEARGKVPNAFLVLAGSGPATSKYKEYARQIGLDGSVQFVGSVRDDAKLVELYRDSDIVVLPSNVGGPISCTILEGLSSGRAVISTNVPGGIPDVLGGGVGILIERGDERRLAEELARLMTDDNYLNEYETNARKAVVLYYTLDEMVDNLTRIYTGLAK